MNISLNGNHCCGCGACAAVCPVGAISMKENRQGFCYPVVDHKKCIDCGKCIRACAFHAGTKEQERNQVLAAYALKHSDEAVRAASRSGGVFTALSDLVLDAGGVVYGCTLRNHREAVHVRATTKAERDTMRGSKYIQSKTQDVFACVKNDLKNGLWVLFSGTACQVGAVKAFCRDTDCEKLLLIDVVCHGVPSPRVWSDYLIHLSGKDGKQVVSVDFRNKQRFGWEAHIETVGFADGTVYSGDAFKKLFYDHYILRRDCFQCPYKNLRRFGDITIADCWGITKHYPEFDDNKGVSLVLVNTEKGSAFFSKMRETESIPVDIQKLLQPPLRQNWPEPADYDRFWEYYDRHSFGKVVDRYVLGKRSLPERAVGKVRRILGRAYRRIFRK